MQAHARLTEQIAQKIAQQKGQISVRELAGSHYLSQRQLERNSDMLRLHYLIRNKICNPAVKWGTLAYEYNYYDQMHFIKTFCNLPLTGYIQN